MAEPFAFSPLFRMASREIRAQAQTEWAGSSVGRLVREVRRGLQSSADPAALVTNAIHRYGRNFDPHTAVRDLMGVDFRSFTHGIERYARGDMLGRTLVREFLRSMGPAGSLIWSLVGGDAGTGAKRTKLNQDIDSAVRFLEAFGFEVLPPRGKRRAKVGDVQEAIRKSVEFLRQVGYPIGGERTFEEEGNPPARRGLPFGISPTLKGGRPRRSITLDDTLSGGRRRYPVGHPIVTGDMVDAESSNVHSYGYDIEEKVLYVRFIAPEAKKGLLEGQVPPHTPGPLYRYRNVPEDLFLSMLDAPSKGAWIWEHIRIEGTVSGHMYPYDLVGVTGGYVPRKAEFGELHAITTGRTHPDAAERQYGEWYIPRKIWTTKGKALESERPLELVQGYTPSSLRPSKVIGPGKPIRPRRPHG